MSAARKRLPLSEQPLPREQMRRRQVRIGLSDGKQKRGHIVTAIDELSAMGEISDRQRTAADRFEADCARRSGAKISDGVGYGVPQWDREESQLIAGWGAEDAWRAMGRVRALVLYAVASPPDVGHPLSLDELASRFRGRRGAVVQGLVLGLDRLVAHYDL